MEPRVLQHYIGGAWRPGGGSVVDDINPSHPDQVLATFRNGTPGDAEAAVSAAQQAAPGWARTPAPARGRLLGRLREEILRHRDRYIDWMVREQGKTPTEASGEFVKGINLVEYFQGEGFRLAGETLPSEVPQNFTYTVRSPLGAVALITPWNFPFAIPIWKICPALVAGNTVVFKPASLTPGIAVQLVEDAAAAGFPPGVVNLVLGPGRSVGEAIVSDPRIRGVSFTGSNAVGGRLAALLAGRPVKVTMEMGGKNAVVVTPTADLDLAVTGVMQGAFGAAGQRCTATSRVLVHRDVWTVFRDRLLGRMERLSVGPSDSGADVGPLISADQLSKSLQYVEDAAKRGAAVAIGGGRTDQPGFFMQPTLLDGVDRSMSVAKEEVFGPVLCLMPYATWEEAAALANEVDYGLSAAVYSRDLAETQRFVDALEVGMIHINNPTIGGEAQLPFGGIKASGLGPREMGHEGTLFFTETKTVFVDYSGGARTGNFY